MDEAEGVDCDVEGEPPSSPGREREFDWSRYFGGYQIYEHTDETVMTFDLPCGKKWKKRIWPRTSHPQSLLRWNTVEEILSYLISFDHHEDWVTEIIPKKPPSGSIFFFNKEKTKRYRSDGYEWKTRRGNEKSIREDRMKLKVRGFQLLYGCYTHSASNPNFHRRSYWLIQNPNLIMVHYLEVYPELTVVGRELQGMSDLAASVVPSNWEFLTISDGNFCALMNGVHSPEQVLALFTQLSQVLSQNVQRARDLEDAIEMNNAGLPCDAYKESRPKRQKSNSSERKGVPILIGSSSEAGTSSGNSGGGSGGNNSERIQPRVKRSSTDLPKVLSLSASGSKEQSLVPNGASKGLSATSHIILCFPKDASMSYVLLNSGPMKVSEKLGRSIHRRANPKQERGGASPRSEEGSFEGGKGAKRGRGKGKGKERASKISSTKDGLPLGVGNPLSLIPPVDQDLQPPLPHVSSTSYSDTPNPIPVLGTNTSSCDLGSSKPLPPKQTSSDYDPNTFSKFANFLVNMDPLEKFGGGLGEHSSSEEEVGVYSTPMDTPMATNDGKWEELEAREDSLDSASDSTASSSDAQLDDMEVGFSHDDGNQTAHAEEVMPHLPATPLSWLVPPAVLSCNGHTPKISNPGRYTGNETGGDVLSSNEPPIMDSDAFSSLSNQRILPNRQSSTGVEEESLVNPPGLAPSNPTIERRDTHLESQASSIMPLPKNGRVFVPLAPTSPGVRGDGSQDDDTALNLSPLNLSPTTLGELLRSSGIAESPTPLTDMGRVSQFLAEDPSCDAHVRTVGGSSNSEVEPLSPLSHLIENMTPSDLEDAAPTENSRAPSIGGGTGNRESTSMQNGIYDATEDFGPVPISQTSVPNPEFTVPDISNPELRVTGCDTAPRLSVASTSSCERAAEGRTANVTVSPASAGVWTPCVSHSGSPDSIRQWLESTLTTGYGNSSVAAQPDNEGPSYHRENGNPLNPNLPHSFDNALLVPSLHTSEVQAHSPYLQSHTHAFHVSHSHAGTELHSVTDPAVLQGDSFESVMCLMGPSQADDTVPLSMTPTRMPLGMEGSEHDRITGSEIVGQDANWAPPLPEYSHADAYHDPSEGNSDDWRGSGSPSGHSISHSASFEDHLYSAGACHQRDKGRRPHSASLECLDTEVDHLRVPLPQPLCGSNSGSGGPLSPQSLPNLSYSDRAGFGTGFRSPVAMGTRSPRSPRASLTGLTGSVSPLQDITEGVQMELENPVHTLLAFEGNELNLYGSHRPVCSSPIPSSPSLGSVSSLSTASSLFDPSESPSVSELCELLSQSPNVHQRDFSHMTLSGWSHGVPIVVM